MGARAAIALIILLLGAVALLPAQQPGAARVFTPAETIAVVGDQHILAGDLLGEINHMLAPYVDKVPEDQLNEQRRKLMKQILPGMVENKILYLEFLREVPPERLEEIRKTLYEEFDAEKLEGMIAKAKLNTATELDELLRKYGSSLEKQRRAYMEQKLGRAMMAREIDYQPEITHEEMLEYYEAHAEEFYVPAKARWEQLTVRFSNHSDKPAAWRKIASMGNEVLRGKPLAAVAREHSEASNASDGGQNDWVTKGALASAELDQALFALPLNHLSQIIDDGRSFHIVRVTERQDEGRVAFVDAQEQIKEKLKKAKIMAQVAEYVEELKARTSVWTIFDDENAAETASRVDRNSWQ